MNEDKAPALVAQGLHKRFAVKGKTAPVLDALPA